MRPLLAALMLMVLPACINVTEEADPVTVTIEAPEGNNCCCCCCEDDTGCGDAGPQVAMSLEKAHVSPRCEAYQVRTRTDRPNLYMVLDRSSSMKRTDELNPPLTRMQRALRGLDEIALSYADKTRLGLSTYPCSPPAPQSDNGWANLALKEIRTESWEPINGVSSGTPPVFQQQCMRLNGELLAMGSHSSNGVIDSYRLDQGLCQWNTSTPPLPDQGEDGGYGLGWELDNYNGTPTGAALYEVLDQERYCIDDPDLPCAQQHKNVVLITDGEPIRCGDGDDGGFNVNHAAYTAAQDLLSRGVFTYVVGFGAGSDPASLQLMAQAGGTSGANGGQGYWEADTAGNLSTAFDQIVETVNCSMVLDNPPNPLLPSETLVAVNGTAIAADPVDGYSYNPATGAIYLHGAACQALNDTEGNFEVFTGCEGGVDQEYEQVSQGHVFKYAITPNIAGAGADQTVTITDLVPACLTIMSLPASGWYCSETATPAGAALNCQASVGSNPGVFEIVVKVTGPCEETIVNCAEMTLSGSDHSHSDCDELTYKGRRRGPPREDPVP